MYEDLTRLLLDNAGCGVVYIDKDWLVRIWNAWMAHRTGMALEDVLGAHIKKVLVNAPETFFDALKDVQENSLPRVLSPVFHMSYKTKELPTKQFIKILPVIHQLEKIEGILIIIEDVTTYLDYEEEAEKKRRHLKALEEKARRGESEAINWLKEQLDFNNALTENLGEGIIVFNWGGLIKFINPATEKVLGWNNAEIFGIHVKNIISDPGKVLSVFDKKEPVRSYEEFFKKRDGEMLPVSYVVSPIIIKGEARSAIITFLDISEKKAIEEKLKEGYRRVKKTLDDLVRTLSYTSEVRDPYTAGHQRRVTRIALAIAEEMGFDGDAIEVIKTAGIIHDIGKIAIPSEILSKPGKLTIYEMQMLKGHSRMGYEILKDIEFGYPIANIILQHHERVNGTGYPDGLKGDEILMEARILAVADVVEAMASHRPYRPALGIDAALEEIEKNAGEEPA